MFNTVRPTQAPSSLSDHQSYREPDVIQALSDMFFDKCYICETKNPWSLNVEHLDAHQGDIGKKYDWNNLYYSCGRCNNLKMHYYNNLLDCTDPSVDVLRAIRHVVPSSPYAGTVVIDATNNHPKTLETRNLIKDVFNKVNTGNRFVTRAYLVERVFKQYKTFLKHLNVYNDDDSLPEEKNKAMQHLKHMMRKEQEYSAFIRWTVLDAPYLKEILEEYMD